MTLTVGGLFGFSKQFEMFLMTIVALWVNIFDMAIFDLSSNIEKVWDVKMDNMVFNMETQYIIKMVLSGIIFVRTFSLHIYIAFLIALFWPSLFSTRPTLMLPWLVVSAVKNLGTGIMSLVTGIYICLSYGPLRDSCFPFITAQIIELSPSIYMWAVGLSMYRDLKKPVPISQVIQSLDKQEFDVALRRRKVKSMINEETLKKQFESKSFQKKYLGTSAVEVKEILNTNCYENLNKNFTRSLDSLLDVLTVQAELMEADDVEPIENEDGLTLPEKTAKLLGISLSEIINIKRNKENNKNMIFAYPLIYQKKTVNSANNILKFDSPAKLLPATSLYTPNIKPIRSTKSELKSNKGFLNLNDPSTFSNVCDKEPHRQEQVNFIALNTAETVFKKEKKVAKKEKEKHDLNLVKKSIQTELQVRKEKGSSTDFIESEIEIRTTNFITLSAHDKETTVPTTSKPSSSSRPSSARFEKRPPPFSSTKIDSSLITIPHTRYDALKIKKDVPLPTKKSPRNEFSCQVSTLSRKVLQSSPEEMTKRLSQLSNKNKSVSIDNSATNSIYSNNSNPVDETKILRNKGSKSYAAIGGYSYYNIHKEKFNRHKKPEKNLCVDKFGLKSKTQFLDDGYTKMINLLGSKSKARNKRTEVLDIQDFSL